MSTRCQIGFYDREQHTIQEHEALVYQHFDGYPSGVLPTLVAFCKEFIAVRPFYAEYLAAQLVAKLIGHEHDYFSGYGVGHKFHGDIDYFYRVDPSGIHVFHTHQRSSDRWEEITTAQEAKDLLDGTMVSRLLNE